MFIKKQKTQYRKLTKSFSYIIVGDRVKVEICDRDFFLFINNKYANCLDSGEDIIQFIKDKIVSLKTRLNLKGFYKVLVFYDEKVGFFVEGKKLDEIDYSNSLDLRILIMGYDIYFETEDYFLISDVKDAKYLKGHYYCLVKDIVDIDKVVEHGKFIYGEDALNKLSLAKRV